MNENVIRGRLFLFLGESRPIPFRDQFFSDEDLAAADAEYIEWQASPETQPLDQPDVDRFLDGFYWLVDQLRSMDETALSDDELMVPFYDAAKFAFGDDKSSIRKFFRYMYIILFSSESGPRWSQFVRATGIEYFLKVVEERTSSL